MVDQPFNRGFTLIELMIVVTVIGIMAAIAYPSYTEYVTKARRAEAQSYMTEIALMEDRWRANDTDYATTAELGIANTTYYNFTITNIDTTTYTIEADPKGIQATRDSGCDPLTLDQDGAKGPAGCWKS